MKSINHTLQVALEAHHRGECELAALHYRSILRKAPKHPDACNLLGAVLLAQGDHRQARPFIDRALQAKPGQPVFLNNLGQCQFAAGELDAAQASFEQAIELNPDVPEPHNNLGNVFRRQGKPTKAYASYKEAIRLRADFPQAWGNLGVVAGDLGLWQESLQAYHEALRLQPNFAEMYNNLGWFLMVRLSRHDEARPHFEKALALRPVFTQAMKNLGEACRLAGELESAEIWLRKAMSLAPNNHEHWNNLAAICKDAGRMNEAKEHFEHAIELEPREHRIYSNMLLALVHDPGTSAKDHSAKAFGWDARHAAAVTPLQPSEPKSGSERLRIGFVSADLRRHAVAYFVEPLWREMDGERFEIVAYSNSLVEDDVTKRLMGYVKTWRNVVSLDDQTLAKRIREDEIDILVDLSGHTAGNRLLAFAYKPAPVQVTWLGYPASTGMAAMDWRISDPYAEPQGMTEHLNREQLWRLPEVFCVYRSGENSPEVIAHPPAEDVGHITFGSMNNFAKVTDQVIALWSRLLKEVPDSKLLLEIKGIEQEKFRKDVEQRFAAHDVGAHRLILLPRRAEHQYALYNRMDIALDPFPCNGGTTSMDCLWMGVPFVTLEGRHFVSRMGVTLLSNVGLSELIAQDEDEYVHKARRLAQDRAYLKRLREGLRERVVASPLMDAKRFTRHLEEAFVKMAATRQALA